MATVFKDMALDDEDQEDMAVPCDSAPNRKLMPRFPWGLSISFDEKVMEKMDLDPSQATVGGVIHLHALARITSVSSNTTQDGKEHHRCELQIEQMAIESEDEENKEADRATAKPRAKLRAVYGK